jgi:hypothetical protein
MLVTVLFLSACGGANNASSNSSSGSSDSDKPSGPDLTTPAGAAKAVADAFASGDFAKFDPLWAKSATQEKKDKMKKEYGEIIAAGGPFKVEFKDADIVIEGDKAKVKSKLFIKPGKDDKAEEENETLDFVKEDGKWKYEG